MDKGLPSPHKLALGIKVDPTDLFSEHYWTCKEFEEGLLCYLKDLKEDCTCLPCTQDPKWDSKGHLDGLRFALQGHN